METKELTRRLAIARLAVSYYEAQAKGEPFEVQSLLRDSGRWVGVSDPTFDAEFEWRRKPKEPRRLVLHRYRNNVAEKWWSSKEYQYQKPLETATFIEVLPDEPTPEPPKEPERWWVARRNLWFGKRDAKYDAGDDDQVVQVVEVLE